MYRPRGAAPNLKLILAKVRGDPMPKHTPMKYSSKDSLAAKAVLDRLFSKLPARNEISYIRVIPEEVNGI